MKTNGLDYSKYPRWNLLIITPCPWTAKPLSDSVLICCRCVWTVYTYKWVTMERKMTSCPSVCITWGWDMTLSLGHGISLNAADQSTLRFMDEPMVYEVPKLFANRVDRIQYQYDRHAYPLRTSTRRANPSFIITVTDIKIEVNGNTRLWWGQ